MCPFNDFLTWQELRESPIQGRVFVDSAVEFGVPDFGFVDFASIDAILNSNYTTMYALTQLEMPALCSFTLTLNAPTPSF